MIDKVFAKHGIEDYKYYPITHLHKVLTDLGLTTMRRSSFTTDFINRKIGTGQLDLPPKKPFDRWKVTGEQMKGIVLSFAPGGKGYWSYKETPNATRVTDS